MHVQRNKQRLRMLYDTLPFSRLSVAMCSERSSLKRPKDPSIRATIVTSLIIPRSMRTFTRHDVISISSAHLKVRQTGSNDRGVAWLAVEGSRVRMLVQTAVSERGQIRSLHTACVFQKIQCKPRVPSILRLCQGK